MCKMARNIIHLLDLRRSGIGIYEQLVIEEALLRADRRNWCIINSGHAQTAIVMGISGQAHKLVNMEAALSANVPVIRRFTGGGTVVVDHNTLFVSFICNQADTRGRPLYPRELMHWSHGLYAPAMAALAPAQPFALHEHDYCLGDRKVGGNAQSVSRDRWVHHTSWLWDFSPDRMALLSLPEKRPAYRQDRQHEDFLTTLSKHVVPPDPGHFLDSIVSHASSVWGEEEDATPSSSQMEPVWASLADVQVAVAGNERRSNRYVSLEEEIRAFQEKQQAASVHMQ